VALVIACVVIDLFPRHGPPDFRYTGADPAHEVWNLGWPQALAIYDSQSGIHPGPALYVVVPAQAVLASLIAVFLVLRSRRYKVLPQTITVPNGSPFSGR
jgi:hypothetical protein